MHVSGVVMSVVSSLVIVLLIFLIMNDEHISGDLTILLCGLEKILVVGSKESENMSFCIIPRGWSSLLWICML